MKILHLVFHPDLSISRANSTWKSMLDESGKTNISRDMYAEYPDFQIDVKKEQELLVAHDRIVIQFPLYWYSCPPLLKKWLDDVLEYNFAYGSKGTALHGKDLQLLVSVGGRPQFYNGFNIYSSIPDLLRPFHLTANFTGMKYLIPEFMYQADSTPEEVIKKHGEKFVAMIDDPARSDPQKYLLTNMASDADEFYESLTA